ncbi:Arginine/agmatine antiporter [Salmonella enterica subsp. enterica serovar Inverness str. R8-3668]|uniref:Arginine/agmatine antiporter n=1 Tax=Salmonella enterica subsp. enterica serovar Inverness str. R8-3668 TaxID=913075 RepID=G5NFT1_SALET|nr:Arginine/agmatine antiporter [Salmonella enterica subsp. enterica serovar Inverness str. R8-3668]
MGSGVFLLPANLAATGGIAIYGWLVTIIGALALSMVYAKMSSLDPSPGGSYAYARRCFGPFLGYQTNVLYWLACWIGNIAMVVIGVGYLSYFFPILKDPLVLTLTCVAVLWIFVLLNIVGPKMITRVQAVATVLALVPIVGIAVFGWFWFKGETYMAAWNVSGMNTFGAIQSTLNVTLWSFIGVESASVAAGVVKNPKRNVPIATIGGVLIAAVCYVLSTTAIMGMIPKRHSYDALCHTIYAACRRLYIMLADSAGRSVRPGRGDRSVRPELAHAGIMVVRETFRDAIAAFNPQLVLRSSR